MTPSPASPIRTGEMAIQDAFQRDLESGLAHGGYHQKVMMWNHAHDRACKARSLVVMNSLETTTDKQPGGVRQGIFVNIWGLVDAMEEINRAAFQAWLIRHPHVRLSVRALSEIAATHLANLFESQVHGDRTNTWRLLLALGEKHAWEQAAQFFGLKGDPRVLQASDLPGGAGKIEPLHYRPCYTNSESPRAFLDLIPDWLDEAMGKVSSVVKQTAHRRLEAVKDRQQPSNRHAWVREFPMGEAAGQREYADFALLINGLPLALVELKTPAAGIKKAVRDFQQKPTYQGAPLCLAGDGRQVIMASTMTGPLEAWVHYARNTGDRPLAEDPVDCLDSSTYVSQQLLSRPERMEFFLRHVGSINEEGRYLVGRSQQYQALSKWGRDLAWTQLCNEVLATDGKTPMGVGNRLVRQTQRTGKTHTMIRAIQMALGTYPEQFRLATVMVGEVLILGQIQTDMESNDLGLSDSQLQVHRIESRTQLSRTLARESDHQHQSEGRVLLVNMQKISAKDTRKEALSDSQRTLVVVDEGHLAQTGTTADVRDLIFPQASHLLLTATPKGGMSKRYGITQDFHLLDDFGYGLAQQAGMVCPTVYKRHPYGFADDPHRVAAITEAITQALGPTMSGNVNTTPISTALEQVMSGEMEDVDEANDQHSSHARALVRRIRRQLEKELIIERLDAIVNQLIDYRESLEKDAQGQAIFRPRALAFARDTESAMDFIRAIWAINGENAPAHQKNVYRGFRFALDVSDFGKSPDGELRTFAHFNPGIAAEGMLKDRMKSMDPDLAVDVLFAVGKYTKGYNNDQLALVALLRNIGEPSLINQIFTRPATMREGKPKGVCLDLAFGMGNVACWNESLRLYDRQFDLDQLYTQEKVDDLVEQVAAQLGATARTLNLDMAKLADYSHVVTAFEGMDTPQRKAQGRAFILGARATVDLIAKMPDSSIYKHLRAPLVGLKVALAQIQSLYPDLVASTDVGDQGGFNAGHTDKSLGDILRQALAVLGQSSLKVLLDVRMGDAREIIPTQRQEAVIRARQRHALRASKTAIERITGRSVDGKAMPGEAAPPTPTRALRSASALTDSLNRVLDKLRDDSLLVQGEAGAYADRLREAGEAIDAWVNEVALHGGELQHFLRRRLDELLDRRSQVLGVNLAETGISEEMALVLDVAATHMAHDFQVWHGGLAAQWAEKEAPRLTQAWKAQYAPSNLSDFLGDASRRQDRHGLNPNEWIARLLTEWPAAQIRALLGSPQDDERTQDLPLLLSLSMELALGDLEALRAAADWRQALSSATRVLA